MTKNVPENVEAGFPAAFWPKTVGRMPHSLAAKMAAATFSDTL
jgi:hypothetical protein